jgi:anti-sigma B factor antagonist
MSFSATSRPSGAVEVFVLSGRITLGDGSTELRDLIRKSLERGRHLILLDLADVEYIDSTGLGELVSAYRLTKSRGGEVKLLKLNKKVTDLLQVTKLYAVFDIHTDEAQAVSSF